ncbi:glycosyltransferase [Candidatus Venteria ishoeyi]|uniref:Hyaluronan synthase n=1 Tax=Candidatus Venteria ishoeyi TaxID=1899563 RepID=A0A1H6F9C7_9GAMM|nr:glycosyltransferase [Candidatus Venteria ishoeyi]SEH06707.1 Hyaluronan synthase [Candidatus Venteria ishoeyi]
MSTLLNWLLPRKAPQQIDCIPWEIELKRWASSEWIEYQTWLFRHAFVSLHDWKSLRSEAQSWQEKPLFSLITPVYNTPLKLLFECIYSVRTQAYPYWELCLVDDGSSHKTTLALLDAMADEDKRLRVLHLPQNQGICAATNAGLAMARGDYVGFLDHDDRLAPNALHAIAKSIRQQPDTQVLYSDRDMLSPRNTRFMHLFKPGWSPETLLSGNYLFHLLVYRRDLLEQLGGVRGEFEGSQDYDLILRAADVQAKILHLPQVLYHWRQHENSVSLAHDAKAYAYEAGTRAVQESLQRRGLQGEVMENPALWRGNYRVKLQNPKQSAQVMRWSERLDFHNVQINSDIVILGEDIVAMDEDSLLEMQRWLQVDGVGLVTGKLLDNTQIVHAGLVQRPGGEPLALYAGHPETTPGYMAVTATVRNVSSVHPACCAIRLELWQQLGGLNPDYQSGYALLDFSLRALQAGHRIVYTPFARFQTQSQDFSQDFGPPQERQRFAKTWENWLAKGDPYYNQWLTLEMNDMGLAL